MRTILNRPIDLLHKIKIDWICRKKIHNISRNIPNLYVNRCLEKDYIKLWSALCRKPSILFIRCMCTISGIISSKYVPENIYYQKIEPTLNHRAYALTYNDKNFIERYFSEYKEMFPRAVLRGINGVFYDNDYEIVENERAKFILSELSEYNQYILKPAAETSGGVDIFLVEKINNEFKVNGQQHSIPDFVELLRYKGYRNFILQYRIKQHQWMDNFNKSSVNVIRLYTYRSIIDNTIHLLHAYIRFGKEGNIVDGLRYGGRTCGISNNGILYEYSLSMDGEKYYDHNIINMKNDISVPLFNEIKNTAFNIASSCYYHRLLGFDFTIDINNKIRLFEINNNFIGIINQQMNSGPLFGEYTDEIINYCTANKKTGYFHYYI